MVERFKSEHGAEVEWHPFYLRPDMPPEGIELPDYLKARTGQTNARLKEMANAVGLEMVFSTYIPHTRLAHEATETARQRRTSKLPMTFLPSLFVFLT